VGIILIPPNPVWGDNDSHSEQFRLFLINVSLYWPTLSVMFFFQKGLMESLGAIAAQLGTGVTSKITGCSNHSDKTEGVRLTEVVNRDREP